MLVALLLLAALDASAPPPKLPSEALGGSFAYEGDAVDRGLHIEVWRNHTLGRVEHWHKADDDYFIQVADGTYVRGWHDGREWRTDPRVRLVRREGAWRRVRA